MPCFFEKDERQVKKRPLKYLIKLGPESLEINPDGTKRFAPPAIENNSELSRKEGRE